MQQPDRSTIDALSSLYQGEFSAVQSYERALVKFDGQPEEPTLRELLAAHEKALRRVEDELTAQGGRTPEGAGVGGTLAAAAHYVASLVNDEVPLQVLQQREQSLIDAYDKVAGEGPLAGFAADLARLRGEAQAHHEALQRLRDVILEQPNRPMI